MNNGNWRVVLRATHFCVSDNIYGMIFWQSCSIDSPSNRVSCWMLTLKSSLLSNSDIERSWNSKKTWNEYYYKTKAVRVCITSFNLWLTCVTATLKNTLVTYMIGRVSTELATCMCSKSKIIIMIIASSIIYWLAIGTIMSYSLKLKTSGYN